MGTGIYLLKLLFSPFILLWQSFRIYFLGCLGAYLFRAGRGLFCGFCICCNCTFKDKQFPATAASIGNWDNKNLQQVEQEIEWKRIRDVVAKSGQSGAKLFSGDIHPSDICQGQLGDCWLMSACACLAGQEGAIQRCFLTREYTAYGKYRVRIFDGRNKKWQTVVIDDWVPCKRGTGAAIFAKPNGDEAWVLLLEKAMAKFKGSYQALHGGSTLYALEALTGDYVFKFLLESDGWRRYELVHGGGPKADTMITKTTDLLGGDEMFDTMLFYSKQRSVMSASSGSGKDSESINGIVQGHAYTVEAVRAVKNTRLVRLRNPWGTFEWQGAWGDNSPLWDQNPKVKRAVSFKASEDGSFWMEWKDFQAYFKSIDFCSRTTGWDDLRIDIHEHHPWCGPTVGCFTGCLEYWFCCKGVRALCCAKNHRTFRRAPKGCCASCVSAC